MFRQTEPHTAGPLVSESRASHVEMANEKLKRHKSPDTGEIPAELVKAGNRTIRFEVHIRGAFKFQGILIFFLGNGSRQKRESCWRRRGCSLGWARPSGNTLLPVECL